MATVELMQKFPPAPETQVSLANWRKAPFNKWSFMHVREIIPSADISNRPDAVSALPSGNMDFQGLRIDIDGAEQGFVSFLEATDTDGLVVLHKGELVYEYYSPQMSAATPHIFMSVSKSILGLIAGILHDRGTFGVEQPVTDFVPEVKNTAYARATIRDLLDMRVGVYFDEDYTATAGLIINYRKAQNWDPLAPGEAPSDLRSFFSSLTKVDGRHGGKFHYVSPNTDLLGWVFERAAGKRYADIVSEMLWQPMGAANSAYITVDRLGAPRCAGGFCATTRDLARVGQLLVTGGWVGCKQIVPAAWIEDILVKGDRVAWDTGNFTKYFPGMPVHYRNKWYVLHGRTPMIFGVGVHGQNLFVDPEKEVVISKFSSQAMAMDERRILLTMKGIEAIRASFN
jgi:CubicO group peptidase (beta-lactamase class C family)